MRQNEKSEYDSQLRFNRFEDVQFVNKALQDYDALTELVVFNAFALF